MTLGDLLEFHKDYCEVDIMQNSLFAHVTSSPFTGLLTSFNSLTTETHGHISRWLLA